jgi:hypothetical protein
MIYLCCKGKEMTYQDYIIKCEVAKTVFQCGVKSSLIVENATPEQRLAWIADDLAKLEKELEAFGKAFDEQDEVGDPFVGLEVK